MAYDSSFVEEVLQAYRSQNPSVETSPKIVRLIAQERRMPEAKIRGILVANKVYLAKPKARTVVEQGDSAAVLAAFQNFSADDDGSFRFEGARYKFIDDYRKTSGYTSVALENFARSHGVWPLSKNERDLINGVEERSISRGASSFVFSSKEYDIQKRIINAQYAPKGSGLLNPWVVTAILLFIVTALVIAAIKSLFS